MSKDIKEKEFDTRQSAKQIRLINMAYKLLENILTNALGFSEIAKVKPEYLELQMKAIAAFCKYRKIMLIDDHILAQEILGNPAFHKKFKEVYEKASKMEDFQSSRLENVYELPGSQEEKH